MSIVYLSNGDKFLTEVINTFSDNLSGEKLAKISKKLKVLAPPTNVRTLLGPNEV